MENTSGIRPCGNRILIEPDAVDEVTEGGILIPKQVTDRHADAAGYGKVIALGPDCYTHAVTYKDSKKSAGGWEQIERATTGYTARWVNVGNRVAFRPYIALNSTGEDGKKYLLLNDEDILAVVTKGVTQTTLEARKPLSAA